MRQPTYGAYTRYIRQNESRIFDLRQRLKAQRSD